MKNVLSVSHSLASGKYSAEIIFESEHFYLAKKSRFDCYHSIGEKKVNKVNLVTVTSSLFWICGQ